MKIGFIGLGKLGLPVAVAMSDHGADVTGFDVNNAYMDKRPREYVEAGPDGAGDFNEHLAKSNIKFGSFPEAVVGKDIVFVAVQTPHEPMYEGITPLPETRADFDYSFLVSAVRAAAPLIEKPTVLAIISTVLPGTIRKHILPLAGDYAKIVYNPQFIAMGRTMYDFLNPEFVLIGGEEGTDEVARFYADILPHALPLVMSFESAELAKVSYNTVISQKIGFANAVMEVSEKIGANCDDVIDALSLARRRVVSPAYMRGGMGDGGGCHPRDNIAMSWLARTLDLSHDVFEDTMLARQHQAEWLADLVKAEATARGLPIVILGYAYKPDVAIIAGSPALLVHELLERQAELVDPFITPYVVPTKPSVFLIGCKHSQFQDWDFPVGSVVIDPHRYIPDRPGVTVKRLGEGKHGKTVLQTGSQPSLLRGRGTPAAS